MIHVITTETQQHTTNSDAETLQVLLLLLQQGEKNVMIMKDVYDGTGQPTDDRAEMLAGDRKAHA